jgi:IclR family KDG regulon transcriptional repressor
MFELGAKALQYPDLVELSKPHMQRLSDATGETVHLGMLIDSEIIYVHKVDSPPHAGHVLARRDAVRRCTARPSARS